MQVTFSFAGEIIQVLGAIPWVRCASGNVFYFALVRIYLEILGGSSEEKNRPVFEVWTFSAICIPQA